MSMQLFNHQVDGIDFLVRKRRACLWDDMGLGKTAQAIVAMKTLRSACTLIICPTTLKRNWAREIEEWNPGKRVMVISGTRAKRQWDLGVKAVNRPPNYIIVNYELLRLHLDELLKLPIDGIIMDEAHKLKNRSAKMHEAASLLSRKFIDAPMFCLSATPILNRVEELWSMLHMVDPKEHSSYWKWVEEHMHHAKALSGFHNRWKITVTGGPVNPEAFKAQMSTYGLRRIKEDVLDLPPKMFETVEVELEGKQREMYDQMRDEFFVELSGEREVAAPIWIAMALRLKQIALSPDLIDDTIDDIRGAKIDALEELIEDSGDQQIVVFSQFSTAVERLTKRFAKYGSAHIMGKDSQTQRQATIDAFQAGKIKVLFVSTLAGGIGITLTAGRIAVFMDLLWTPALNAQAADRLHRIGQTGTVTVYTLEAVDTIEEYINQVLANKQALFDATIPEDRSYGHWKELLKK